MVPFLQTVGYALLDVWLLLVLVIPVGWSILFAQAEARRRQRESDTPPWESCGSGGDARHAVVLIHGTFAPRAAWTLASSRLSSALQDDAHVWRFDWSGANSMRSRRRATDDLRRCVAALASAGFERVSLVAHSHGGNIALKACEQEETAARVHAIVCLATPFISAWSPRTRVERAGARWGIAAMVVLAVLGIPGQVGLPSYFALVARLEGPQVTWADGLLLSTYLAVGVGVGLLIARQFRSARIDSEAWLDLDGSICSAHALAPLVERTLIISTGGDEADGVLKMASALNRSIVAGSNVWPVQPGEARAQVMVEHRGAVLAQVRDALLAGLTHTLGSVANLAFGIDGRALGPAIFMTSSETPVGQWRHWHVDGVLRSDEGTLAHSSLYDAPPVIDVIRAWVRNPSGHP